MFSLVKDLAGSNLKTTNLFGDLVKKQIEVNKSTLKLQTLVEGIPSVISKSLERYVEPEKLAQEIITEVDDRSRRARNVLILNVKEPIENTSFRRRNANRNTAVDTINSLGISPAPKISRVYRIGKWSDSKVQCRPLLVEVGSMHQRD